MQNNAKQKKIHRTTQKVLEECGPCPVIASYTLEFALQLRKTHGKKNLGDVDSATLASQATRSVPFLAPKNNRTKITEIGNESEGPCAGHALKSIFFVYVSKEIAARGEQMRHGKLNPCN